jgi:hypothetical protein
MFAKVSIPARKVYYFCRDRAARWCAYSLFPIMMWILFPHDPGGTKCSGIFFRPNSSCKAVPSAMRAGFKKATWSWSTSSIIPEDKIIEALPSIRIAIGFPFWGLGGSSIQPIDGEVSSASNSSMNGASTGFTARSNRVPENFSTCFAKRFLAASSSFQPPSFAFASAADFSALAVACSSFSSSIASFRLSAFTAAISPSSSETIFSSCCRILVSALAARNSKIPSPASPPTTITRASFAYANFDLIAHLRGVLALVRVFTSWVGKRSSGWNSSIITPTKRAAVEPISHQKNKSDLLISESLAGSETNNAALDHSSSELPLWPVWVNIGLFIVFVIACIANKPKDE